MGESVRIAEEYASKRVSRLYYRAPKYCIKSWLSRWFTVIWKAVMIQTNLRLFISNHRGQRVGQVGGEVHSERATVGKEIETCFTNKRKETISSGEYENQQLICFIDTNKIS